MSLFRMVGKSWVGILFLLFLDFFVTTALAILALFVLVLLTGKEFTWSLVVAGVALDGPFGVYGVLYYSTYMTSVWVWLYVVSVGAMRTLLAMEYSRKTFFTLFSEDQVKRRPLTFLQMLLLVLVFIYAGVKQMFGAL